jgi:uncharacterized protein DUF6098
VELPGLSANALAVEPWWGDRSPRVWVARRLYDYQHLRRQPGNVAWVLAGRDCGRGPDNEPLIVDADPVAFVDEKVAEEARSIIEDLNDEWGTLGRGEEQRPAV